MRSRIPSRCDFHTGPLARERRALFGRVWRTDGFAAELQSPDDFVATEVGGKSVVVRLELSVVRQMGMLSEEAGSACHPQEAYMRYMTGGARVERALLAEV